MESSSSPQSSCRTPDPTPSTSSSPGSCGSWQCSPRSVLETVAAAGGAVYRQCIKSLFDQGRLDLKYYDPLFAPQEAILASKLGLDHCLSSDAKRVFFPVETLLTASQATLLRFSRPELAAALFGVELPPNVNNGLLLAGFFDRDLPSLGWFDPKLVAEMSLHALPWETSYVGLPATWITGKEAPSFDKRVGGALRGLQKLHFGQYDETVAVANLLRRVGVSSSEALGEPGVTTTGEAKDAGDAAGRESGNRGGSSKGQQDGGMKSHGGKEPVQGFLPWAFERLLGSAVHNPSAVAIEAFDSGVRVNVVLVSDFGPFPHSDLFFHVNLNQSFTFYVPQDSHSNEYVLRKASKVTVTAPDTLGASTLEGVSTLEPILRSFKMTCGVGPWQQLRAALLSQKALDQSREADQPRTTVTSLSRILNLPSGPVQSESWALIDALLADLQKAPLALLTDSGLTSGEDVSVDVETSGQGSEKHSQASSSTLEAPAPEVNVPGFGNLKLSSMGQKKKDCSNESSTSGSTKLKYTAPSVRCLGGFALNHFAGGEHSGVSGTLDFVRRGQHLSEYVPGGLLEACNDEASKESVLLSTKLVGDVCVEDWASFQSTMTPGGRYQLYTCSCNCVLGKETVVRRTLKEVKHPHLPLRKLRKEKEVLEVLGTVKEATTFEIGFGMRVDHGLGWVQPSPRVHRLDDVTTEVLDGAVQLLKESFSAFTSSNAVS